ncbi:MAG: winged helix-turn-helix domain-containing protein [Actinomyces sp.]|jgi:DNA-binding winged helix-turn-helix (wHTH) protein|nr:winged helix-turn-helix domain-containing protein [Actinomyces sp.]MCI1642418.1 winged helix-turn-helix domain-containing protein [Actinomyces sp.]MCI1662695.1 winged helix-turn-helix domain-containing protein [Actinomyces sp.]MCI1691340.1 winged helix-turn-helix domain-containing protein [Actinomyces sp.]MCI1788483.1 winged helix-turn-helix domain-containing protein [Actinomyces sp.]MCI1831078.1 winged helix-turn-helix domain-containing protein [Actinomyces sp.]
MALVDTPARPVSGTSRPPAAPTSEAADSLDDFLAVLDNLRLSNAVTVNLDENTVRIDRRLVDLTRQEFALLAHLARNADRTVSREELFSTVWRDRGLDAESRTVDAHIRRLRRKLDVADLLTTVRGEGYRFNSAPGVRVVRTRRHALAA